MKKKALLKTFCILMVTFCFKPIFAYSDVDSAYKKWTYRISKNGGFVGRVKIDCTLVGDDLINAWIKNEKSQQSKDRIQNVFKSANDEGIYIYLLSFHLKSNKQFIYADFSNIKDKAKLYLTDETGNSYCPIYITGNLNQRMYGGQNYYGLLIFKTNQDFYSFQSLSLKGEYVNERFRERNNKKPRKHPAPEVSNQNLQFSYMPYGVKESERPSSTPDAGEIFSMLRLAFKILTKFI